MPTALSDALRLDPLGAGRFGGTLTPDWGQGRAAFGGIVGAWGVAAMRSEVPADRALRSVLVNFVAPLPPGAFEVQAAVLRSGRAATQAEARVSAGGGVVAVVTAAFGAERPTKLAWPGPAAPAWAGRDERPDMPYVEGLTPAFTQHYRYRWFHGDFPYSGGTTVGLGGWIRPREAGPLDELRLLAMLDAWPAPFIGRAQGHVPMSTLSWMANLFAPAEVAEGWCQYDAHTVVSAAGYADFDAKLWGPDGALVATSRQAVVEFSA